MQKKWHIVYTKPLREKKVAEVLGRRKVEHYCPLRQLATTKGFRKKIVSEPLFTSYVFVFISELEVQALKRIPDIINVVYYKQKPAIIHAGDIEMVRSFLTDYSNVRIEKGVVNLVEHAAIEQGPLLEREGNVFTVSDNTVRGYLPSLGYYLVGEAGKVTIEVIAEHVEYKQEFNY
jgi:transcription antitermination factor NusG